MSAMMQRDWKPLFNREAEREKQIERIQEKCRDAYHRGHHEPDPASACPRCALEWVLREIYGVTPWVSP